MEQITHQLEAVNGIELEVISGDGSAEPELLREVVKALDDQLRADIAKVTLNSSRAFLVTLRRWEDDQRVMDIATVLSDILYKDHGGHNGITVHFDDRDTLLIDSGWQPDTSCANGTPLPTTGMIAKLPLKPSTSPPAVKFISRKDDPLHEAETALAGTIGVKAAEGVRRLIVEALKAQGLLPWRH